MRRRNLVDRWWVPVLGALLFSPVLLIASGNADVLQGPLEITTPPHRVGDEFLYENHDGIFGGGRQRVAIEVEGAGRAVDRFGIEREVYVFRSDRLAPNGDGQFERVQARRCHVSGGEDNVQIEFLDRTPWTFSGERRGVASEVPFIASQYEWAGTIDRQFQFLFDWCGPTPAGQASTYREGQRLPLAAFERTDDDVVLDAIADIASHPAEAVTFAGRPALRVAFTFAPGAAGFDEGGRISLVVADGLPGFVAWDLILVDPEEGELRGNGTLVGFRPAAPGATPLPILPPEDLPGVHPTAPRAPIDRLAFDDAGFDLPFRFKDAWDAALRDPATGLAVFVAQYDDPALRVAKYDRLGRHWDLPSLPTQGTWTLVVCDDAGQQCLRADVVRVAAGAVQADAARSVEYDQDHEPMFSGRGPRGTPDVVSSVLGKQLIAAAEPAMGEIKFLVYWTGLDFMTGQNGAAVRASDLSPSDTTPGNHKGRAVTIDLHLGAIDNVMSERATVSPKPLPFSGNEETPRVGEPSIAAALETPAGIASAAAATLGLALIIAWLSKPVFVPMFTRIVHAKVLDQPVRRQILEVVEAQPGIHFQALRRATGTGQGALEHHLAKLNAAGLLSVQAGAAHTCYFARGRIDAAVMRAAPSVRAPSARAVLAHVRNHPGASVSAIAGALGVTAGTASRHVVRLTRVGLLEAARQGRTVHVRATPLAERVMAEVG